MQLAKAEGMVVVVVVGGLVGAEQDMYERVAVFIPTPFLHLTSAPPIPAPSASLLITPVCPPPPLCTVRVAPPCLTRSPVHYSSLP